MRHLCMKYHSRFKVLCALSCLATWACSGPFSTCDEGNDPARPFIDPISVVGEFKCISRTCAPPTFFFLNPVSTTRITESTPPERHRKPWFTFPFFFLLLIGLHFNTSPPSFTSQRNPVDFRPISEIAFLAKGEQADKADLLAKSLTYYLMFTLAQTPPYPGAQLML